jgi:type VI secretion system secreted protein VgrG
MTGPIFKQSMSISSSLMTTIKAFVPFSPCAKDRQGQAVKQFGQETYIGYAHLIENQDEFNTYGQKCDADCAHKLLESDLKKMCKTVNHLLRQPLTQSQYDALILLALDIGKQAFSSSSVLRIINDPSSITGFGDLEQAWKAWSNSQSAPRREMEWQLFIQSQ